MGKPDPRITAHYRGLMKNIPYFAIPAVLFIMACGIFLFFHPDKVDAQLALHNMWYSSRGYALMGFVTGWGEWPMILIVILVYALRKFWWWAGEFLAAGILSSALVQTLKKLVFTSSPRPMGVIEWSQTQLATDLELPLQFAFPSGHTTTAFVFFTLIALHWRRPVIQLFAAFCAIAVAISRVYLMVHWIADVMAGAVLGMSLALVVFAVSQRVQKKPLT